MSDLFSLVIPVYKSEANLDRLLAELGGMAERIPNLEVVFVVDGSPDRSYEALAGRLDEVPFSSQLLNLSRNFGAFSAIGAGLTRARGDYIAVLAADLQEPPSLAEEFFRILRSGEADVVFGVRTGRSDPWFASITSRAFWALYHRFVLPDMPPGGVDVFGCTRLVRDRLVELPELDTSLVPLLFWLGFRRQFVRYHRQARTEGRSSWTFRKRLRYAIDGVFNFSDLPIQLLTFTGLLGTLSAIVMGIVVIWSKIQGRIPVSGYTPTVLAILFFGGIMTLGLGILGQYLWLTLRNARRRPNYILESARAFEGSVRESQRGTGAPLLK